MKFPGLLKKGTTNVDAVKALKAKLNESVGSTLDVANGNFGDSTEAVVKQFQKKHNLLQDGIVGELTWMNLFVTTPPNSVGSIVLRFRALETLQTQLHVREKTNNNDGIDVEKYLKAVGLPKGYAWCMAFVYWGFKEASEQLKVKNPVPRTAGVLDCLSRAKAKVVALPQPGDQFIMDFGAGKGHTGMVVDVRGKNIFTVEGNTSSDPSYVGEDREGNGVFQRSRPISSIKNFIRYT